MKNVFWTIVIQLFINIISKIFYQCENIFLKYIALVAKKYFLDNYYKTFNKYFLQIFYKYFEKFENY